jgi:hypothetical protein
MENSICFTIDWQTDKVLPIQQVACKYLHDECEIFPTLEDAAKAYAVVEKKEYNATLQLFKEQLVIDYLASKIDPKKETYKETCRRLSNAIKGEIVSSVLFHLAVKEIRNHFKQ